MGQTLSKDRIAPMIRDTPRLTGLVDTKSRYAGNTVMKKNFPNSRFYKDGLERKTAWWKLW
jgi:phage terminase large subunit GpA-like protein